MTTDISFVEIGAKNAGRTRAFLEQLFGWPFHPHGGGENGWFQTPALKAGLHGDDPSPGFLVFFGVADLEAAIEKVRQLGGKAGNASDEPGFGGFSICSDPDGLPFGLHQMHGKDQR